MPPTSVVSVQKYKQVQYKITITFGQRSSNWAMADISFTVTSSFQQLTSTCNVKVALIVNGSLLQSQEGTPTMNKEQY